MNRARRVKQIQTRARIRKWEFRQRHLAHGGWHRFRLALAMAREAYAIDQQTLEALIAEGFARDQRGQGLEPAREIVWISSERAAALDGSRSLAIKLDQPMLAARCLALVPFPGLPTLAE